MRRPIISDHDADLLLTIAVVLVWAPFWAAYRGWQYLRGQ